MPVNPVNPVNPVITVAVVVRNGAATIEKTLLSLFSGERPPDEVLIIDGQSHDNTLAIARKFPVRIVDNPRKKIAPGRNIGIQEARGDIIAYTDSDCIVAADWVARIARSFADDDQLTGIGGKMRAAPPRNAIESFAGAVFLQKIMRYGDVPCTFRQARVPGAIITANCAYRRSALLEIGGFDEYFGSTAEDIDLFWRLLETGHTLKYDPLLLVEHVFPRRITTLCKKHFGFGLASSRLTKRHARGAQIDVRIYLELLRSAGALLRQKETRARNLLSCLQLLSHLAGKYYGSVVTRCINL